MALFYKSCADKFGLEPDRPPFLCERCGKEIPKRESIMKIAFNRLGSKG